MTVYFAFVKVAGGKGNHLLEKIPATDRSRNHTVVVGSGGILNTHSLTHGGGGGEVRPAE